jgi:hypothetical protein
MAETGVGDGMGEFEVRRSKFAVLTRDYRCLPACMLVSVLQTGLGGCRAVC